MSLIITGYSNIAPSTQGPEFDDNWDEHYGEGYFQARIPLYYAGHADGLVDQKVYKAESFKMTYAASGLHYRDWRWKLSCLVCDENGIVNFNKKTSLEKLINFSDCEGIIGSATCAEILAGLNEYHKAFNKMYSSKKEKHFRQAYASIKKAFELGANNGCVIFQ